VVCAELLTMFLQIVDIATASRKPYAGANRVSGTPKRSYGLKARSKALLACFPACRRSSGTSSLPITGSLLRQRSHADSDRGGVLRPGCPQSHVVRGGTQDHPGGCGQRRLGRGGNRLQCRPRSAFPLAHRGGRSPRILNRCLGKSHAHIGPERLRMGRLRVDFVPARDAHHGRGVWVLARVAILFSECIGDLSRAGVRVRRPGNRNLGSQEYQLTFNGNPLPYGCGSARYNICGFV